MRLDTAEYAYPVDFMCAKLGASRSGYYEWRNRPESSTAARREELKTLIAKIFEKSDSTYGYRRVHAQLRRWDVQAGPELVRRLMRDLDLVPCQPKPRRVNLTKACGLRLGPGHRAHRPGTLRATGEPRHALGCDTATAVARVSERIHQRLTDIHHAQQALLTQARELLPPQEASEVARLAALLRDLPGTHLGWLLVSDRYPPAEQWIPADDPA